LTDRQGFTLVEILVSLTILVIFAMAVVPLFVFVAQATRDNKARSIAAGLAASEIERILEQANAVDYSSLEVGARERTETLGGIQYVIHTSIEWVDDPKDGLYPDDAVPFDYKRVRVSVSAPSAFSGEVTKLGNLETLLAREGGEDPYSGILVQVTRGWNGDPVENALVTITPETGVNITGWTNERGQALFDITLPQGVDSENYNIKVSGSHTSIGRIIMHPEYAESGRNVTVDRYSTKVVTMEVEKPSQIELSFNSRHLGGKVILRHESLLPIGGLQGDIAPGATSIIFEDLWPVGEGYATQYELEVELVAYDEGFDNGSGNFERQPERVLESREHEGVLYDHVIENLWKYDGGHWVAGPDNYELVSVGTSASPGYSCHEFYDAPEFNRLLTPPIDLTPFRAVDVPFEVDEAGKEKVLLTGEDAGDYILDKGTAGDDFALVYQSIDQGGDWKPVFFVGDAYEENGDLKPNPAVNLGGEALVNDFKLRFDSISSITRFEVNRVKIKCYYGTTNLFFNHPGETRRIVITE
jgi:prepilin-type N-terminal cleavage/methylation domain-containing protein